MNMQLRIDDRPIGEASPTFVIAEIGVNHDGEVSRAIQLVREAARAGADAVKLQLFSADRLVQEGTVCAEYQTKQTPASNQRDLLRKYELSVEDVERVIDAARVAGLVPLATPFSVEDVFICEQLNLPAIKLASPDLVNLPLIRRSAKTGKPLILSTGAADTSEIDRTCAWLRHNNTPAILMHCVSSYPTPIELANLGWIGALAKRSGLPVGYSDHTTELLAGAMAVASGAVIVEKHLTWNRYAQGPDHSASADPTQFAVYVKHIRFADAMRGAGERTVLTAEADVRKLSRQSIAASRDIIAGELIDASCLTVCRPGTGIAAWEFDRVVGMTSRVSIRAGAFIEWNQLENRNISQEVRAA